MIMAAQVQTSVVRPPIKTVQEILADAPSIPIVHHTITDEDIGLLPVSDCECIRSVLAYVEIFPTFILSLSHPIYEC